MKKLIIADDHPLVREGLKRVFSLADDIDVIEEAVNGTDLMEKLHKHPCHILLLDMSMPGICGFELIERIRKTRPSLPILVLSICDDFHVALRAFKVGATGYSTKDVAPEELIAATRKVADGQRYVAPKLAERMALEFSLSLDRPAHERLTERELQILHLLATGKHITEIGKELSLSAKTVSTHKSRAMEKLGVKTTADLIRYSINHNLFESR